MNKLLAKVFGITQRKVLFVAVGAVAVWKIKTLEHFRKQISANNDRISQIC